MDSHGIGIRGQPAAKMTTNQPRCNRGFSLLVFVLLILGACSRPPAIQSAPSEPTASLLPPSQTQAPATPTATPTQTRTSTPESTPTPEIKICSPLESIPSSELAGIVSNPFAPPSRPGSDDPHQGVDLADIDPQTRISLEGRLVQAALAGTVAAVIQDRFPYGNAVLIETRLETLPTRWQQALAIPTPAPTSLTHPVLTCPTPENSPNWESNQRSIYILYAHLQQPPEVNIGEAIDCGQTIGKVGKSGNALNPHLHVEARVGPGGARFPSMAHYTGNASQDELRNYCLWRVSANFA